MGFGKDGKGAIVYENLAFLLGAAGAGSVVTDGAATYLNTLDEDFRLIKIEGTVSLDGAVAAEGPITFGIAAGDMAAAEIETVLEAAVLGNDHLAMSDALSPIFPLGQFYANTGGQATLEIEKTIRWTFKNGSPGGWHYWIYNHGATLTTGSGLYGILKYFGVWKI